jgi:tripartite motif-containing protein 71
MTDQQSLKEQRKSLRRRVRWWRAPLSSTASLGALVLTLVAAVPVLASESPEAEGGRPPSPQQVAEGLEAVEREEAAHKRELEEPDAVRERDLSADAYEDATPSESQQLLLATFQAEIERLNSDPARALGDLRLVDVFGETVATVRGPGDDGSLLEAGVPIRVENEDGDLEKVKLDLVEGSEGFEAENPLTEILIPPAADEQFSIGDEGLGLVVQGGEAASGESLGEMNVYYPEVQKDTDLLVAPVAGGLEFFDQLRSSESPEALHFHLNLPDAASLRAIPAGGALVVEGGETRAVVPPPVAVDAQGTSVPLELEVEGSDLTLRVPHRSGDYAYPILVDPAIEENYNSAWYSSTNFSSLSGWQYSTNDPTETYILHNTYCLNSALCSPSGRGLFISSMNRNIPANTYGQWYYYAPGGSSTYIPSIYPTASAYLNPFWRDNGTNCGWESYPQPHDYDGAFDAAGNWQWLETDRAQWYGNASMFTKANGIAIGLSTGNSSVNIPCWRNIMLGGFVVRLDDSDNPVLSSVTGFPSGWTGAGAAVNVTANIGDGGLGVRNVKIYPAGMPGIPYVSEASECPGTKTNPCPASRAAQFSLKAESFDEGEKQVQVSGWDPTGKVSNTYTTTLRIDRQPPEITLGGQLGKATRETEGDAKDPTEWDELSLPVYNLEIRATDGSAVSAEKKRSGVKSIEVFLDADTTPKQTWTQECSASSCSMTRNYSLQLAALSPGKHLLKVVSKDQVNQPRAREIGFEFVPATGMKDEYVMHHFPLPDGKDHSGEATYGGPELAVNVANGNLVFREEDVDVEGPNVDLEVERVYNSLLPTADNTEWGDGWTLASTPQLEPVDTGGSSAPDLAKVVDETGGLKDQVAVPAATGTAQFDPNLQSTLKKTASGFELTDETGESEETIEFNSAGRAEGVDAAGEAAIDFDYEGSALTDIAVEDPTSSMKAPPVPESLDPLPPPAPRFESACGSAGSGPGQMQRPADVLADADGTVWVLDRNNSRVERFNANGEFVSAFGTAGSGDGQLSFPNAMALDAAGNIWVLDAGNYRVEKFSKQGAYLGKFTVGSSEQGVFTGLAVDAKGNILVSSWWTGGMVQKFSPSGQSLGLFAPTGTGVGQISEPTSIAVAPDGKVWVVDAKNRVQVYGETGSFIRQFGSSGSGNGQFNLPVAVEVDAAGHVWVVDQKNSRVQEFTESGVFLAQFGSAGTGSGQFSLNYPAGITADDEGRLWVTDSTNNRVQRWVDDATLVRTYSRFESAFGSAGTGPAQMQRPADVLIDGEGTLWVLDRLNNRVERFNASGEFVSAFGTAGSGDGQLSVPTAMALDSAGNLWILDAGNYRVEKFSKQGAYLGKFTVGTSEQGFFSGIAVDAKGNILVSSQWNGGKVQRFSPSGQSLGLLAPTGTGAGQISEPTSIAVAPNGNVWVVDGKNRVQVFAETGSFIRQFGSAGSGSGQFNQPVAVEVDHMGHVWVLDSKNSRVQEFTESGRYLAQFGSAGTGSGQFSLGFPGGLAADKEGDLWVTDSANNRVQRWSAFSFEIHEEVLPPEPANDPAVDVSTTNGLVTSVIGTGAGTNTYSYSGDDLIANKGPEGETKFTYDSGGRMTKVALPNGTVATAIYDVTFHRVISLTVDPAGEPPAKTTTFSYTNEPRKTVVTPSDAPAITYEIGTDGSVFKWWNIVKGGPEISLAGTLWINQEKEITVGLHNLEIQADAVEGVSSIQVIANGDTVVEERTCNQDPATPGVDCLHQVDEWVVETGSLAPGTMSVEVLATDRIGNISSKSFWFNVPYTPPPNPEEPLRPTFAETKRFREDYGLDRDLNPATDQQELNNRIYDLLGAWGNPQTPEGAVARSSAEKWGVPLRPADVAEMEYREWYMETNLALIEDWAETHRTSTYAGYFVDHRNGGPIRVGFTADQAGALAELKQQIPLVAADRVVAQVGTPTSSRASLETTLTEVEAQRDSDAALASVMLSIGVDEKSDAVEVTGTDVALIEGHLKSALGASVPIKIVYEPEGEEFAGRNHTDGRIRAGDRLIGYDGDYHECTGGFGAWDRIGTKPNGEPKIAPFALTAAHCAPLGRMFYRQGYGGEIDPKVLQKLGHSGRTGQPGGQEFETDGSAILLNSGNLMPYYVFINDMDPKPVGPAYAPRVGETLCFSGVKTNVRKCGEFVGVRRRWKKPGQTKEKHLYIITRFAGIPGDSGAPVWSPRTGGSVGLLSGGPKKVGLYKDWVTPLVVPRRQDSSKVPGILNAPGMGSLHLAVPGG